MYSFVFSSVVTLLLVPQTLGAGPQCECYKTSAGDYFTNHEFLDFRNGKPADFDTFFTILEVPNYGPLNVKNTMTAANIGFDKGSLSLVTTNDGTGQQKSADIYSTPSIFHGSFRMHAQIIGAPGAVVGFFTYLDAYNEQDIEILTNEANNQIHFTTHNNGGAGAGNPNLNTTFHGSRTDFNTYRFDWTAGKASFRVNHDPAKLLTVAVPTQPCPLNVNMWSAGDGWGGAMAPGQSASLNIEWIEAVYNSPGADAGTPASRVRRRQAGAGSCANACKIDGVAKAGIPEPL